MHHSRISDCVASIDRLGFVAGELHRRACVERRRARGFGPPCVGNHGPAVPLHLHPCTLFAHAPRKGWDSNPRGTFTVAGFEDRWASGPFSLKPLFIKGLRRFETRESPECPLTAYSFRIRFLEGQICTQSARDCLSDGNPPVLTVRVRNWCGALLETDILVMKLMQIPA